MKDTQQTLNTTDPWKSVSNIGYTRYINVSDGTERTVPWGHLEWFITASSTAVTLGLLYGFFHIILKVI